MRSSRWAIIALAAAALGCELVNTDVAIESIPTPIATPSWRNDIAPVLAQTCASSGACHFGAAPQEGLNLEAESSYANVVNVLTNYGPVLVTPGDSVGSFLVRVMSTDITVRAGYPYRMPLTEIPMPSAVVQTIKNWIAQGANDN